MKGKVGSGKTSAIVRTILELKKEFKIIEVYANMYMFYSHLDREKYLKNPNDKTIRFFPNFHYTPYYVFNYQSMINEIPKVIILDDMKMLSNLEHFLAVISSYQRKINSIIFISEQYAKMIKPEVRDQINDYCELNYMESRDLIEINVFNKDHVRLSGYRLRNISRYQGFFDTNQIVKTPNERRIKDEIKRVGISSLDDLEDNLAIFFKNKTKFELIKRQLISELDIKLKGKKI